MCPIQTYFCHVILAVKFYVKSIFECPFGPFYLTYINWCPGNVLPSYDNDTAIGIYCNYMYI